MIGRIPNRKIVTGFLSLVLFALSSWYFSWNNNFSLGLQVDEVRKVDLLRYDLNEYKHPLYMRQVLKPVIWLSQVDMDDSQRIAELGRWSAAIHGGLAMLFFFWIVLFYLKPLAAFLLSLSLSATAIVTVHAHYFKEDIFLLLYLMMATFFALKILRGMFLSRYLLLGLAISSGLLLSCHYKGFLFAGIIYIFLYIHFKRPRLLIISALIAFFVFLVINLPLFLEFVQFRRDVQFELTHFNDGHAYPVYFTQTAGLFHLTKSLFPGVGLWVILIVGLTVLMSIRIFRSPQVILVLSLLIIYWMVLEFGPLKPHPDYGRYALPLVPMLFILFAIASGYWKEKYSTFNYINPTVIVLIGVLSIYRSWPLVQHLTPDTRNQVALEYEELKEHCYFELYALPHPDWSHPHKLVDLSVDSLLQSGFTTAMISSFWYERFIYGAGLPSVDSIIIQKSDYYTLAIDCEIRRFESESGFYAFSNPLIHEIDLVKFSSLLAQTGIASGH